MVERVLRLVMRHPFPGDNILFTFISKLRKYKIMKKKFIFLGLVISLCSAVFKVAEFPEAKITNGIIKAKLYLPDVTNGYYHGTRFDWGGVIPSLEYKGHTYFGKWFDNYDPKLHDAISGPVEEFTPLDYKEVQPGSEFVKIGVGILKKADEEPYSFARNYEIVDNGRWTVKRKNDVVEFKQELADKAGYAYIYLKTVRLTKGKPELVLEHILKNVGKKAISTSVYNHNFFMIDNEPTGPGIKTTFSFDAAAEGKGFGTIVNVHNKSLLYTRPLEKKENVFSAGIQGLTQSPRDYDIKIENIKTGAGVRITSDQPIEKLVYWACSTTACPEPYIKLNVEPGKEIRWRINYEFFEKKKK